MKLPHDHYDDDEPPRHVRLLLHELMRISPFPDTCYYIHHRDRPDGWLMFAGKKAEALACMMRKVRPQSFPYSSCVDWPAAVAMYTMVAEGLGEYCTPPADLLEPEQDQGIYW